MITPVLRMIQAALKDVTFGIAVQLKNMVADGDDIIPEIPTIINSADDDQAVQPDSRSATAILDWPLLILTAEQAGQIRMTGIVGQPFDTPSLTVMAIYVTGETMSLSKGWRDADYTGRAAILALDRALFGSDRAANRVRGKVTIVKHNSMTLTPANHQLTKGRITGILSVDLWIRTFY